MPRDKKRSRLEKLQNSWAKATPAERYDFLSWISGAVDDGAEASDPTAAAASAGGPIASGRYLLPPAIQRIRSVMAERGLTSSDVMAEMGFGRSGQPLKRAMDDGASLRLAVVAALERWLLANTEAPLPPPITEPR